jgi:hypothetical protein
MGVDRIMGISSYYLLMLRLPDYLVSVVFVDLV